MSSKAAFRKLCLLRAAAERSYHAHFEIDGEKFLSAKEAYAIAKSKGLELPFSTFARRLSRGCNTWNELLAPSRGNGDSGQRSRRCSNDRLKEGAEIAAAIDARKKAMGLLP